MATTEKKATPKKTAEQPAKKPVSSIRLDDTVRVRVRSNQYGTLLFKNNRTGDVTRWEGVDEVQIMTAGDIRYMKSNAAKFVTEPWVWIEGIEDPACENLTTEEIYEVLGLGKQFKQYAGPLYLGEIHEWTENMIGTEVPKMSKSMKTNTVIALNTEIRIGRLNNLKTIKAWESALGCELDKG